MAKLSITSPTSGGGEEVAADAALSADDSTEAKKPAAVPAYNKSSFFDTISCDALDAQSGQRGHGMRRQVSTCIDCGDSNINRTSSLYLLRRSEV